MSELLGVVLAGGKSSRMGRSKASLAHPDGGTFLDQALGRLEVVCRCVCVAGLAEKRSLSKEVVLLPDLQPDVGPIHGLVNALMFASQTSLPGCLVTPVDVPNLKSRDLDAIVRAWQDQDSPIVGTSGNEKQLEPLIGIYPVQVLDELKQLSENKNAQNRSLHRWIRKRSHQTIALSESACFNVNTPNEFQDM